LEQINNNNNILVTEQFGFRAKLSTAVAPYSLISEILNAVNNKNLIVGIFCNLTKASDCINHDILLSKLRYYGITGIFYSLMKSYLENRHHRVQLENNNHKSCSSWGIVKHGVLQGSVLGPLLFLFYINDVTKIKNTKYKNNKSKLAVFVDDTSLIIN
jgi:hypothetical protein